MKLLRGIIQKLRRRNRAPVTQADPLDDVLGYRLERRPLSDSLRRLTDRFLDQLPDRDYEILRHFKLGKKHSEIAELMGMDIEDVRRSLTDTYVGLMMLVWSPGPDGDDGLPAEEQHALPELVSKKAA